MKVIEPSYEIIKYDGSDEEHVLKHLEACGRTCYKSDHKIRQGSAEVFVKGLMKNKHEAMIEHASVVVRGSTRLYEMLRDYRLFNGTHHMRDPSAKKSNEAIFAEFKQLWYAKTALNFMNFSYHDNVGFLVSGNFRAWRNLLKGFHLNQDLLSNLMGTYPTLFSDIEVPAATGATEREVTGIMSGLDEMGPETKWLHKYVSVRFICNRGFTHELVRMRPCSFAQESTRYVDYFDESNRGKGEMKAIKPEWFTAGDMLNLWIMAMEDAEKSYQIMRTNGAAPGEARGVLPIDVKTEIVITTNLAEWYHIFGLRTAKAAHQSMRQLMRPVCDEFKKIEPEIFGNIKYD